MNSSYLTFRTPDVATLRAMVWSMAPTIPPLEMALRDAREVILFGSYACGSQYEKSDIDILVVNETPERLKNRQIDLIGLSQTEVGSARWVRSELAHHVATYGVWLKGKSTWARLARPGLGAIRRKENRIVALSGRSFLSRDVWPRAFVIRSLTSVCLDIMRLQHLERRHPVPSRQMLMASAIKTSFENILGEVRRLGEPFDRIMAALATRGGAPEGEGSRGVRAILGPIWSAELEDGSRWRRAAGRAAKD
jgi:hypothetical protein